MPPVLAEAMLQQMPEVEAAITEGLIPVQNTLTAGEMLLKASGAYVESGYFNMFSYGLMESRTSGLLDHENNIVVSRELAERLFGTDLNVVGKSLTLDGKEELMIAGVFDIPASSSRQFDFAIPFRKTFIHHPNFQNNWNNSWPNTYVVLKAGTDPAEFNRKIESFYAKQSGQKNESIFVTHFSDGYLYGKYENGVNVGGRIQYVRLFLVIACFILVIACINFANLATARASQRIKEVGIKKTFGVTRRSLALQYLVESLVITTVSLILAIVIDFSLIPQFNLLTGKELQLTWNADLFYGCLAITGLTALVAGSYPALYLSGFSPAVVLKGKLHTSTGALWTRKGLVVLQFSLSVIFMIAVFVVYKQMELIQTRNMGYNRNNIIYFEMEPQVKEHQQAFVAALRDVAGVEYASDIWWGFLGQRNGTSDVSWPSKDPNNPLSMQYRRVDDDLIELMGVKMTAGKSFSASIPTSHSGIIFNEAAIAAMGLSDPVGKKVVLWGKEMEIIGVTNNFHFETLYEQIQPLFFIYNPERANTVMVKLDPAAFDKSIAALRLFYKEFTHNAPLDLKFLDDDFQAQYVAERRVEALSKYFTALAMILSCLGLLGLAAYTAERRVKEVGIRKILGATELGIIYLLTREFSKTVFIAIVFALPIGYIITRSWLDHFTVKIDLQWWYFAGTGLTALCISWLTVGIQAYRAARLDPAKGLRTE